jgi:hypothetical protein
VLLQQVEAAGRGFQRSLDRRFLVQVGNAQFAAHVAEVVGIEGAHQGHVLLVVGLRHALPAADLNAPGRDVGGGHIVGAVHVACTGRDLGARLLEGQEEEHVVQREMAPVGHSLAVVVPLRDLLTIVLGDGCNVGGPRQLPLVHLCRKVRTLDP